jgi:hypothetical protein
MRTWSRVRRQATSKNVCQERWWDCVEEPDVELVRSAAMAIFWYFDPCGPNRWVGTGCGGVPQAWATISVPVQDALGGTIALAEAVGARPIVDAAAATASTPMSHRLMLCVRAVLVAMSITSESGHGNY